MPELKFETGLVSYSLNGAVEVSFNPTDPAFMQRIYQAFELLDTQQQAYEKRQQDASGSVEFFDMSRKADAEMREVIDNAFGKPVCESLFGSMNVYAIANGLPVWCNLILTIIDLFGESAEAEVAKTNPRLNKYLKKYHK